MKTCSKCGEVKQEMEFYPFRSNCKTCVIARVAEWQKKNTERCRTRSQRWNKANPHVILKASKKYKATHRNKIKAKRANWYRQNKHKNRGYSGLRRARRRNATPSRANQFFIDEIYELAILRTKLTGITWHVDHIVPLKNPLVCGLHVEHNLQVVPATVNLTKGNRYWPNMPEMRA